MLETTTPRQRRRAARLKEIRDEALALVIDDGVAGFSIHRLAERCDLTPGALYRYFESRDAILTSVQIEVLEAFDTYLQRIETRGAALGHVERIVHLCYAYCALERLQPERFRLISQFVSSPDPVVEDGPAAATVEPAMRLLGRLATALNAAAEAGAISSGNSLTRTVILWSSLQGLLDRQKLSRLATAAFEPEPLRRELLTAFMTGWGADPLDVKAALERASVEDPQFADALRGDN